MRLKIILACLALSAGAAQAATIAWVDWISVEPGNMQVNGTVDVGGETVTVTFTSTTAIAGAQTTGGTDYWTPRTAASPYTSTGPNGNDNPPTGTDIIRLSTGGTRTITFSSMIEGLYFAYVSFNSNIGTFSAPMEKLSESGKNIDGAGVDASGYWGSGTMALAPDGLSFGPNPGEAHGTLFTPGPLASFTFTSSTENWHGFTVGVRGLYRDTQPQPQPPAPIPLPAGGFLLIAALGALALLRRRG
jgi:hypothetical protein